MTLLIERETKGEATVKKKAIKNVFDKKLIFAIPEGAKNVQDFLSSLNTITI